MENPAEILQELQDLSKTKSSDNRRQLLHRVTDLFSLTSEEQEQSHKDAFDQIMDRLAYELETSVRAEFADRRDRQCNVHRNHVTRLGIRKRRIDDFGWKRNIDVQCASRQMADELLSNALHRVIGGAR